MPEYSVRAILGSVHANDATDARHEAARLWPEDLMCYDVEIVDEQRAEQCRVRRLDQAARMLTALLVIALGIERDKKFKDRMIRATRRAITALEVAR